MKSSAIKVNKAVKCQLDQELESSRGKYQLDRVYELRLKPTLSQGGGYQPRNDLRNRGLASENQTLEAIRPLCLEQEILELLVDLFQRMPSLSCGESPKDLQARGSGHVALRSIQKRENLD
ncbi:unnamed protein product [Microthlaspi erraticum]|uniref:Uncharacterized protein n=1 Tax=Microthlaspi erraticum TaxID=1685480 RepID=A0A6D2KIF4_9BRAS|nr:unnamed protein product [Microthlaspi erraticum]